MYFETKLSLIFWDDGDITDHAHEELNEVTVNILSTSPINCHKKNKQCQNLNFKPNFEIDFKIFFKAVSFYTGCLSH